MECNFPGVLSGRLSGPGGGDYGARPVDIQAPREVLEWLPTFFTIFVRS